jgi:hypothetical protein
MALNLKFIGSHAVIKHMNLRKQGQEDDRVLAIDIKVSGETQAMILNDLLGASPGEDLSGMFWSTVPGADPESLKSYAIKEVEVDGEWPNRIVHIGKHEARGDMKKIHFMPRSGHRLDLTAQISIEGPRQELLDYLVSKLQENVTCHIESQPELPFGDRPGLAVVDNVVVVNLKPAARKKNKNKEK